MGDVSREANAKAKAAKAEAKALRPFYKKKRWWVVGVVGLIVVAGLAGSGTTDNQSNSGGSGADSGDSTTDTISSGLGSKDASADVIDLDCGSPDIIGVSYPEVTIRNNSSKSSDYFITIVYESADGSIRYDSTMVMSLALEPGQTTVEQGMVTGEFPSGTICKVTEVQRTAS